MEKFNPGICEITQAIIIPYQGYKDGYMVPPLEIGKDITPLITLRLTLNILDQALLLAFLS